MNHSEIPECQLTVINTSGNDLPYFIVVASGQKVKIDDRMGPSTIEIISSDEFKGNNLKELIKLAKKDYLTQYFAEEIKNGEIIIK